MKCKNIFTIQNVSETDILLVNEGLLPLKVV